LESDLLAVIHNQRIGSLYRQKRKQHGNSPILKISVNRASTIFSLAGKLIEKYFARNNPQTTYWQPLLAKEEAT
jgi:hypothetical protein